MWVFLNDAFVSIVEHRRDKAMLMVRARFKGDIGRAFPGVALKIKRTPDADYIYRAIVPRVVVAQAVAAMVMTIDYANFKSSVEDKKRSKSYMRVWDAMYAAQEDQRRDKRKAAWGMPLMARGDAGFDAWVRDHAVSSLESEPGFVHDKDAAAELAGGIVGRIAR